MLVTGTIGDGWLGLRVARGEALAVDAAQAAWLADRYRLPRPREILRSAMLECASAAADVSDGLIADAANIARASHVGLDIDLDRLPLSDPARAWLGGQPDEPAACLALATGGDDYELVCTASPAAAARLVMLAAALDLPMTDIGYVVEPEESVVRSGDRILEAKRTGYRHGV